MLKEGLLIISPIHLILLLKCNHAKKLYHNQPYDKGKSHLENIHSYYWSTKWASPLGQ
jgi:hypothetical protein